MSNASPKKPNVSKHFDSVKAFYNATHGSLDSLVNTLAEIVERSNTTNARPVSPGQHEAWKKSLPDLAELLNDPEEYVRKTAEQQAELSKQLKAFKMPVELAKTLNHESHEQFRQMLDASADDLLKRRKTLQRWLKKNAGMVRFPDDLQIDLEQPLKETGRCKRIDVLLWRRAEKPVYVVMELKQWTEDMIITSVVDGDVKIRIKSEDNQPLDHPLEQAKKYTELLVGKKVLGQTVESGSIIKPCAYLHNQFYKGGKLFNHELFGKLLKPDDAGKENDAGKKSGVMKEDKTRMLFSRSHCNVLIEQLNKWLEGRE